MERVRLKQVKISIFIKIESLRLDLSEIVESSIRREIVNATTVRLSWPKHPFSVQVHLKNMETNLFESPTESNQTSALFDNLTEASIYQVQFNISKPNFLSINQTTNNTFKTSEHFLISSKNNFCFFRFYKIDSWRHRSII
jgi:hypothetical protein